MQISTSKYLDVETELENREHLKRSKLVIITISTKNLKFMEFSNILFYAITIQHWRVPFVFAVNCVISENECQTYNRYHTHRNFNF